MLGAIKRRLGSGAAVRPRDRLEAEGFSGVDQALEAIRALSAAGDRASLRRARELRHLAGAQMLERSADGLEPRFPDPGDRMIAGSPPEIGPAELTAGRVRAAILSGGCLLVRGAIERDAAVGLGEGIETAFQHRDADGAGNSADSSLYDEFSPLPGFAALEERPWIAQGGGVLAVDSPELLEAMLSAFERIGLTEVISEYLGEPALFSAQKCTLRKADPSVGGAWHQDGNFMGDVRALNVWLSLSRCGDLSPGLDIVPRRIEELVEAGTDGAPLSYVISQAKVEEVAGETPIVRPIFEPGDILLFDDLFLHQTGSDPMMPNPRYAIESWFFGASGFPDDYAPLVA